MGEEEEGGGLRVLTSYFLFGPMRTQLENNTGNRVTSEYVTGEMKRGGGVKPVSYIIFYILYHRQIQLYHRVITQLMNTNILRLVYAMQTRQRQTHRLRVVRPANRKQLKQIFIRWWICFWEIRSGRSRSSRPGQIA